MSPDVAEIESQEDLNRALEAAGAATPAPAAETDEAKRQRLMEADTNDGTRAGMPNPDLKKPETTGAADVGARTAGAVGAAGGETGDEAGQRPFHKIPEFQKARRELREARQREAQLRAELDTLKAGRQDGAGGPAAGAAPGEATKNMVAHLATKYGVGLEEAKAMLGLAHEYYELRQADGAKSQMAKVAVQIYEDLKSEKGPDGQLLRPDYEELEDDMEELLDAMPPQKRALIATDRDGQELLYRKARALRASITTQVDEAKRKGASGAGGAAAPGNPYTPERIGQMSPEEFAKHEEQILKYHGIRKD